MPFAGEIVPFLVPQTRDWEALIPLDKAGKRQPLCAKYKSTALSRALAELGNPSGQSLYSLIENLKIEELSVDPELASKLVDIDTREDLTKILEDLEREIEEI